jgi:hypothetical protein
MKEKDKFVVGDLVLVTSSFLNSKADDIGFVYEKYKGGISIMIIRDGNDLGGFSYDDADRWLIKITHIPYFSDYIFKSCIRLREDFYNGYFQELVNVVKKKGEKWSRTSKLKKLLSDIK